jgi:5-methyltetrahydrofolate--homocysteine methyltransferase
MMIIGEKINGTRKQVAAAMRERNTALTEGLAQEQVEAGSDYLDVNAGTGSDSGADVLVWLVRTVQRVVKTPLCLDIPNANALHAAIKVVDQKPMINSISGEQDCLENALPLVAKHQCPVIVLALGDKGIPKSVDDRMNIIDQLVRATRAPGIDDEKLYIDPLVMAISTGDGAGTIACETMCRVRDGYPDVHLTGGLSNISYGAPARKHINHAVLVLALEAGVDSAIMDPSATGVYTLLLPAEAVLGRDRSCNKYNHAFRARKLGSIQDRITRGSSSL